MKSMTAFARQDANFTDYQLSIEMKSVNHRYLDVQMRLPESLRAIEIPLRESIAKKMTRGRVDVFVKLDVLAASAANISLNQDVVEGLKNAAMDIQKTIPSVNNLSVSEVLHWKGVLQASSFDEKQLAEDALATMQDCVAALLQARQDEGDKIAIFLDGKVDEISQYKDTVVQHLPEQTALLREKMVQKLSQLQVEVDADRFEQEVLFYLNRVDVNEEIERLSAHLEACKTLIQSDQSVGRKLDFMMQELQREANTLGTKSTMMEIKNMSLEMKVAIEQIREQVQNIE